MNLKGMMFLVLTLILSTGALAYDTGDAIREVGLVVSIGLFAALCFYLVFKFEEEHFVLKYFFLMMGVISMYAITSVFAEVSNAARSFYKMALWALRAFFTYILVYFVYEVLKFKGIIGGNNGN